MVWLLEITALLLTCRYRSDSSITTTHMKLVGQALFGPPCLSLIDCLCGAEMESGGLIVRDEVLILVTPISSSILYCFW